LMILLFNLVMLMDHVSLRSVCHITACFKCLLSCNQSDKIKLFFQCYLCELFKEVSVWLL